LSVALVPNRCTTPILMGLFWGVWAYAAAPKMGNRHNAVKTVLETQLNHL